MRSKLVLLGLCALALVTTAAPVFAQKPSIGIAAGISMPQGDFKDVAANGLNGTVAIGLGMPMLPVGLRLEGGYDRFGFNDDAEAIIGESGNWSLASARANVTFGLPLSAIVVSPYVIAGGGMYWGSCSPKSACEGSDSNFGWNAGLGVKLRAVMLSGYIEARYHNVSSDNGDTQFLPITVGIMF